MPPKKAKTSTHPESCFLPLCEPGKCRINSRKNPNCFCQIGEKFWFSTIKDSHWTSCKDPETERKDKLGYVGLKNLGATCYVNTFLQLWFNNKAFRAAIYQWRQQGKSQPTEKINDNGDMFKSISLDFGDNSSDGICGNLQFLFSLLQYSERRYVDPVSFVNCLGLQTDEQQDAQEFSKLFISLLHETLRTQNEYLSNIIDNQFGGSYKYQTKCNICGNISETSSKFYELDLNIKGHSKLMECMKEFLKEEVLDGENRYFCSKCQSKQNATRRIILEKLPPVLNIQLLRFVFDRQTGTKKKLNTIINFPDIIDMNQHMRFNRKEDGIYHLNAVLIHCGLSAHSGHYIAHILDKEKDVWCRYNDENITVMKGKSLLLGREDDPEGMEEEKSKKTKKCDGHWSKNAYMLVYSRAVSENISCHIPDDMMEVVIKDNSLLEQWSSFQKVIRNHSLAEGQDKQKFVQNVYPTLPVKEGCDFEWISTSWLRLWLNPDTESIPPIDNTTLLCTHSCADPSKISIMKRVSVDAADALFARFGGEIRLAGDLLCPACLDCNRKKEEFEATLQEDTKLFNKALKESNDTDIKDSFWVSKKSLKGFKQLARRKYSSTNEENLVLNEYEDLNSPEFCTETVINDKAGSSNNNNNNNNDNDNDDNNNENECKKEDNSSTLTGFQQDIICPDHGNLSLNENSRKLVTREIWDKCREYFPDAMTFASDAKVCELCQRRQKNCLEEKETMKFLAKEQKQMLGFLFEDPSQRMNKILAEEEATFHVILSSFVTSWKKNVRNGGNLHTLTPDNSEIICEHDLLLYTAEEIIDECLRPDPEVILLSEYEHYHLKTFFPVTDDIKLSSVSIKDAENSIQNHEYGIMPDYCPSCRNNRLLSDAEDSRNYIAAPIFITKSIKKDPIEQLKHPPSIILDESSDGDTEENTEPPQKTIKRDDVNYSVSTKRLKLCDEGQMRRSNRKRTKRGEYMIQVNSHQSLKDLKIQVLNIFSVLPIEQTLSFDSGHVLEGDGRYLVDLGVTPGTHLILTVEQPSRRIIISEESSDKPRVLEAGFKGTNLLCGSPS